jgi:hypothetical protein
MLQTAEDPTFLLLIFIWQAAYAWDEALQQLSEYVVQLVRFFFVIVVELFFENRLEMIFIYLGN